MNQPDLLTWSPPVIFGDRDGETFNRDRDLERLNSQMGRVYRAFLTGKEFTLAELSRETGDPEASCSARFRDLSKPKFGGFNMRKRCGGGGLYLYRMVPS